MVGKLYKKSISSVLWEPFFFNFIARFLPLPLGREVRSKGGDPILDLLLTGNQILKVFSKVANLSFSFSNPCGGSCGFPGTYDAIIIEIRFQRLRRAVKGYEAFPFITSSSVMPPCVTFMLS